MASNIRSKKSKKRVDDEDTKPRKKRYEEDDEDEDRPKKKSKSRDDDEDDEEDRPKKSKKSRDDEDEEDDEDDRPKKKSKSRGEDEDDEDASEGSRNSKKRGWATVGAGAGGFGDRKRWDEELNIFDFKQYAGTHVAVRIVDFPYPVFQHWCHVKPEDAIRYKEKSIGKNERVSRYSFVCPDYEPENEVSTGKTCPHCRELQGYSQGETTYYVNAFVKVPSKKKGRDAEWSEDLFVLRLKTSVVLGIKQLQNLKRRDPDDPNEGFSVAILYNDKAKSASEYWSVNFDEVMPLSKEQRKVVKEQIVDIPQIVIAGDVVSERKSLERKNYFEIVGSESESDDDGVSKKSKARKSKLARDDDEDDDEDDDNRHSKKKSKSRDDDDEDEEEEEERPKKKSKFADDDDDDDDNSDDDDDDEDDRPKKKSKKSRDDDDDDDIRPAKASKKKR